ncbi:MAG: hypothetical protein CMJ83_09025 [Planctomycetes bacterium]|nr:hypothetical protein [Planctomycetota bacterium]
MTAKKLWMLPLLVALVVTGLSAQEQKGDVLATLVPANALAVAYIPNLTNAEAKVRKIAAMIEEDAADMIDVAGLTAMAGGEELPIDGSKPAAIAVCPPEDDFADPTIVLMLPFKDAKKVGQDIASMGFDQDPVVRGNYVAFASEGNFKVGDTPSRLLVGLPNADGVLRIDLAAVLKTWGDEIGEGLEMAMEQALEESGGDPAAEAMIKPMFQWTRAVMDSADLLDINLKISDTNVNFGFDLREKKASAMAKSGLIKGGGLGRLAGLLPSSHALQMMMSLDIGGLMKTFMPMYKKIAESMPEEQRDAFNQVMDANLKLLDGLGSEFGFSMGASSKGIQLVQVFTADDPAAFVKKTLGFMNNEMFQKIGVIGVAGETKDGISTVKMKFDWEKLGQMVGQPIGDPEMMVGIMKSIFGEDDPTMRLATVGENTVVVTIGGGEALMRTALAGFEGGAKGGLKNTLDKAGRAPAMVFHMDLRKAVTQVISLVEAMDMGGDMPQVADGPPAPIGVYAGRSGLVYSAGITVEVAGVANMIKQMSGW